MINYQIELEKELEKIKDKKPSLLLHVCCAPCSSYVLEYLNNYFDITVLYYNPNISPYDEYKKRLNEEIRLINEMNKDNIKIMECEYDNDLFEKTIKGLEKEKKECYYKFRCKENEKRFQRKQRRMKSKKVKIAKKDVDNGSSA